MTTSLELYQAVTGDAPAARHAALQALGEWLYRAGLAVRAGTGLRPAGAGPGAPGGRCAGLCPRPGVLHRDLKPANILLDERLGALLTDFGFARMVGESTLGLTMSGGVVGNPAYIAPEVWEGEAATVQTDVYALGCIVYELLCGTKAFPGSTPPAVMRAHFKPLALPAVWPPGVPAGVGDVLRRALAEAPGDRFASAGELAAALEQAQASGARLAPAPAAPEPGAPAQWRRTSAGLLIAGPENIAALLALPDPPARIWWEKADMELCLVPAGEFVMGSPEGTGDDDEHPQHRVYLDSYYIGRTPVTQQQYARFVKETRRNAPYVELDWAQPYNCWDWARRTYPQGKAQHPVVLISRDDVLAFCHWAGLRLPTEAEWEKAARGTQGCEYPWGNRWEENRCNSYESGKGGTTPVGAYSPAGDSASGCADMAGNVSECTSSLYDPYPYQASDGREDPAARGARVVRGGSWYHSQASVRCANREPEDLGGDYNIRLGFRCRVSSTCSP